MRADAPRGRAVGLDADSDGVLECAEGCRQLRSETGISAGFTAAAGSAMLILGDGDGDGGGGGGGGGTTAEIFSNCRTAMLYCSPLWMTGGSWMAGEFNSVGIDDREPVSGVHRVREAQDVGRGDCRQVKRGSTGLRRGTPSNHQLIRSGVRHGGANLAWMRHERDESTPGLGPSIQAMLRWGSLSVVAAAALVGMGVSS